MLAYVKEFTNTSVGRRYPVILVLRQGDGMFRRLVPLAMLAGVVSLALVGCGGGDEASPTPTQRSSPTTVPTASVSTPTSTPTSITTEPTTIPENGITVNVTNRDLAGSGEYRFDPAEFTFNVGDTVTFINIAQTELHSFTVDDLGIDMDIDGATTPGKQESITFTFDKPGEYSLICIYHEGNGMVGTITVK